MARHSLAARRSIRITSSAAACRVPVHVPVPVPAPTGPPIRSPSPKAKAQAPTPRPPPPPAKTLLGPKLTLGTHARPCLLGAPYNGQTSPVRPSLGPPVSAPISPHSHRGSSSRTRKTARPGPSGKRRRKNGRGCAARPALKSPPTVASLLVKAGCIQPQGSARRRAWRAGRRSKKKGRTHRRVVWLLRYAGRIRTGTKERI